jgi:hypothetical protein
MTPKESLMYMYEYVEPTSCAEVRCHLHGGSVTWSNSIEEGLFVTIWTYISCFKMLIYSRIFNLNFFLSILLYPFFPYLFLNFLSSLLLFPYVIISLFLVYSPTFLRLMKSLCCLCISHINFWMPEPISMKLRMYIIAPESISDAYFLNPSTSLCVYMCIPSPILMLDNGSINTLLRQQRIVGGVVFSAVHVV